MKPETIIKRVKEELLISDEFEYIICKDYVAFPRKSIRSFNSLSIACCHFPFWTSSADYLLVYYKSL